MNKTELINAIAERAELTKPQAKAALEAFIETVNTALTNDEKVQIVGFGSFEIKARPARTARNPRTGESVEIEASKAPVFKAGKTLKDAVNK